MSFDDDEAFWHVGEALRDMSCDEETGCTTTLETRNAFSPLADMHRFTSPEMWAAAADEMGVEFGHVAGIARSIITSEHAYRSVSGNCRLNSTSPNSPESGLVLGLKPKVQDKEEVAKLKSDAASTGGGSSETAAKQSKEMFSKAERFGAVLSRVVGRLSALPPVGLLHWLMLSSATPRWKLTVFDAICSDGRLCVNGSLVLERYQCMAIVLARAERYMRYARDKATDYSQRLTKSFTDGDFSRVADVVNELCFSDQDSSWLSGYTLYSQTMREAHDRFLTEVSAFVGGNSGVSSMINKQDEQ